ncbi:MAG: hypothetical protein LBJ93_01255, partial [Clostridiales bacterium]|nr:hypothetical protein [Clostridiales bacterium]
MAEEPEKLYFLLDDGMIEEVDRTDVENQVADFIGANAGCVQINAGQAQAMNERAALPDIERNQV